LPPFKTKKIIMVVVYKGLYYECKEFLLNFIEMDNLKQENKKLEEYISEIKNFNEMIEKTKHENDYLQMVYDKNVSTISSKLISLYIFF